jgi:hypothetical protein
MYFLKRNLHIGQNSKGSSGHVTSEPSFFVAPVHPLPLYASSICMAA